MSEYIYASLELDHPAPSGKSHLVPIMSAPVKLSFSLGKPGPKASTSTAPFGTPKPKSKQTTSTVPKPFSFGDDDDEDESSSAPPPSLAGPSRVTPKNNALIKQNASLGRQAKKIQEEAKKVDQTVFEYDEVWDGMQNARQQAKQVKDEESAERKVSLELESDIQNFGPSILSKMRLPASQPKYIESFLQSAATRKLDRLRAEEKMLQHERDAEGEEFEGKEKFLTTAYKRQMEEVKIAEEEEKAREGELVPAVLECACLCERLTFRTVLALAKERASQKGPGMTAFYRNMLDADEEKHAAAVAASSSNTKPTAGPSLAFRPPQAGDESTTPALPREDFNDEVEEDPFIRRERKRMEMERAMMTAATASVPVVERLPATASTETERIEINDEGAVVDQRVLLKAGLNITKKPKSAASIGDIKRPEVAVPLKSRAVGTDASYEARIARERRRLADMMKDEADRVERERLRKEQDAEESARKRKVGATDGEGEAKRRAAKERFEARKRAKLDNLAAGEPEAT